MAIKVSLYADVAQRSILSSACGSIDGRHDAPPLFDHFSLLQVPHHMRYGLNIYL